MLFVTGSFSSVFIGLKKSEKEGDYVYGIVYTKCDDVRVYDVRVGKTRKILERVSSECRNEIEIPDNGKS